MKIVDARSGEQMRVGQTIKHPHFNHSAKDNYYAADPDWVRLLDVRDKIFNATALLEGRTFGRDIPRGWYPLTVRFTHPRFLFQRVAFINT